MAVKLKSNFLNPFEKLYYDSVNNPLFSEDSWKNLLNNGTQTELETYSELIRQADEKGLSDSYLKDWHWNNMSLERQFIKMQSDLGHVDNSEVKDYDIVTGFDEQGKEIKETKQFTEKQYYDYLLEDWRTQYDEQLRLQELEQIKQDKSTTEKVLNTVGSTFARVGLGAFKAVESAVNLFEAAIMAAGKYADNLSIRKALDEFRYYMGDDKFFGMDMVVEDTIKELEEWDAQNTYFMNVDGSVTTLGKYLGTAAISVGEMLPSIFLNVAGTSSAISQGTFYSSMFSGQLHQDIKDNPSIPTEILIFNNGVKVAAEMVIEKELSNFFGATKSDMLRGLSAPAKTGSSISRYLGDVLQEGLEEGLQEFSGMLIDGAFSIISDDYRLDIDGQQLFDAAVSGMIASAITGGFAEVAAVVNKYDVSKKLVTNDELYNSLEGMDKGKYRKAVYKTVTSSQEIQQASKGRYNQLIDKYGFGVSGIKNMYSDVVKSMNEYNQKTGKVVAKLNKQAIVGFNTLMSFYTEIGPERAAKAQKLLDDINAKRGTIGDDAYIAQSGQLAEQVSRDVSSAPVLNAIKNLPSENEEEKNVFSAENDDLKNEVKSIINGDVEMSDDTDSSVKTAFELAKLYEHDIELSNDNVISEKNGVIYSPKAALQNLPAEELTKSAAERTLAKEYLKVLPKNIVKDLSELYNEFSYGMESSKPKYIGKELYVVYNLLFNSSFYNYCLMRGNVDIFSVIKSVDSTLVTISNNNKNTKMVQQYYDVVRRVRMAIGPALLTYLCNNPKVSINNVTMFTKEQLSYIEKHRYNYYLARSVIMNDNSDGKLNQKINLIKNRIKSLVISDDVKNDMISRMDDVYQREDVIEEMDEIFYQNYFGKYDDKTYLSSSDPASSTFNSFLKEHSITVTDVINGKSSKSVLEEVAMEFNVEKSEVDKKMVQDYYSSLFQKITKGSYYFEVKDGKIKLTDLKKTNYDISTESMSRSYKYKVDKKYVSWNLDVHSTSEYLKGLLKVSDAQLTFTSVNDVIFNPSYYFKDEILSKIKTDEGSLSAPAVVKYIKSVLPEDVSLVTKIDGTYEFASVENLKDRITDEYAQEYNSGKNLKKSLAGKSVNISKFVKNVPDYLSSLSVQFNNSSVDLGSYDFDSNKITIHLGSFRAAKYDNKDILNTILHEYQHALQYYNYLSVGGNLDFDLSKQFISDFKRYCPKTYERLVMTSENYGIGIDEVIRHHIYYNLFGELDAEGIYKTLSDYNSYYIVNKNGASEIVAPWGKSYKHNNIALSSKKDIVVLGEGEKVKSDKTFSQRYEEAVSYTKNLEEALSFASDKKSKGEKLYKKDFHEFKLPKDVVSSIVEGTYKKTEDSSYETYSKVIKSYRKKLSRDRHKSHAEAGKQSDRSRSIFEKTAKGNNLKYWLEANPSKVPELDPSVQEFVISADDFVKLDNRLVKLIKGAKLTLRGQNGIYNYIRNARNINDYTFQEIKKAFFKNSPFTSFSEVKSFVTLVEDAYAVSAALKSVGMDEDIYKTLEWDVKNYKKYFEKLKSSKALSKVSNDTLLRFNYFWMEDSQGKKHKFELNMSDAEPDIVLGLLKYFDKTIDSLAYVAGNAKYSLKNSVILGQPFAYKLRKDQAGHSHLSLDAQLTGKKGSESRNSLSDIVEDERQRLDGNTDAENREELTNIAKSYVRGLISEGKIDEAANIGKTISQNIRSMSDEEVENRLALLNSMENTGLSFEEVFNLDLANLLTAVLDPVSEIDVGIKRHNVYNSVKSIINRLAKHHISGNVYKNLPSEFKKYFDENNSYKFKSDSVKGLSAKELENVKSELKNLGKRIRDGEFLTAQSAKTAEQIRKQNERLRKQNEQYKKRMEKKSSSESVSTSEQVVNKNNKTKTVYNVTIEKDVSIQSDKRVPDKLVELLNVTFHRSRESTMKFQRIDNEVYLQVSMEEFFEQNAETLNELSETDVLEILEFFESASPMNRDYVPYDAMRTYLLAYFVQQMDYGMFNLDKTVSDRCMSMLKGIVSNSAARTLSVWRSVMPMVNPNKIIVKKLAKSLDLDFDDAEIEPLVKYLKQLGKAKTAAMDADSFKQIVDGLQQQMENLEKIAVEKLRKKTEDESKDVKIFGKKVKVASTKTIHDRILKFQKAMMLSAPATAVRNKLSNFILGGFDFKGKHIWGMNDLSDWIGGLFKRKSNADQYNLRNVKVSEDVSKFVKTWIVDSNILDLTSEGLSKYDSRTKNANSGQIELQLQDVIIDTLIRTVHGEHTFGKGKLTNFLESKSGKIYEHGVLDNIVNLVFKNQSDLGSIKRTALKYIGKLLQSNNVDLSKGMSNEVMSVVAEAYTMSTWEYMHRNNFINDLESSLRKKSPTAYFAMKQVVPFAASSWNWFLETLQMNPVSLLINIRKLNNLEKVVEKMDERRRLGDTSIPSSKFAETIVRRNIGKGVVGTFLMLFGFGLGALGKIKVDKEDEKLKLVIGNTYVDISNIFGSSSLLVGASMSNPSEGAAWTVFENAFNQQFEDSMLTQFMNMFRYDNTPYDYLTSLPFTVASTFIPNLWKSAVKLTQNHKVKYSKGFLGDLQYLAMQIVPFMEYSLPKQIDPYTGEWEERYSVPVIHQLFSLAGSPASIKTYNKSKVEIEFDNLGISKKSLSGNYDDIGKVDDVELNKFYGTLNNKVISEFIEGKTKYRVEGKNGKYENLYYDEMSDEQKKNVLNRITAQNANYAKIYVWTNSGHKYYCSLDERRKLAAVGVTKNVYIGNKGFVR